MARIFLITKLTKYRKNTKGFLDSILFFVRFVIFVFFVVKERLGLNRSCGFELLAFLWAVYSR